MALAPVVGLALGAAAALVLYRETLAGIVGQWAHANTYNHAFLVPPIVAWLLWRDRRRIAAAAAQPAPWVLLPMALVAAAWMLGALTDANALMSGAFVALLVLWFLVTNLHLVKPLFLPTPQAVAEQFWLYLTGQANDKPPRYGKEDAGAETGAEDVQHKLESIRQ